MEKIHKRIVDATKNVQLARNEMDRCSILGRPVSLNADIVSMIDLNIRILNQLKSVSAQGASNESGAN